MTLLAPALQKSSRRNIAATHADNLYTAIAWKIAKSLLWNSERFDKRQERQILLAVRYYFLQASDKYACYQEMVLRLLHTKLQLRDTDDYIGSPEWWFSHRNARGYNDSATWYRQYRLQWPQQLQADSSHTSLARSVQQLVANPTAKNFHYWRSYFAERSQRLLNYFLAITRSAPVAAA